MKRRLLSTIALFLLIFVISSNMQASSISIDSVYGGIWDDNGTIKLIPNEDLHFDIRYINNSGFGLSISNGFRVWTTGGSSFTPMSGEIADPDLVNLFSFGLGVTLGIRDGLGADTLGVLGLATFPGLYDGFDDIVLNISTGGIQEGETLCIDSSLFPPTNTWKWAGSGGDVFPSWSGQECFIAECPPCPTSMFTNCIDTFRVANCNMFSFTFNAESITVPPIVRYSLVEGPGVIDSITGEWSYTVPPEEIALFDTLIIETSGCNSCSVSECFVILDFTPKFIIDLNGDCATDLSDLVYLIAYMFQEGAAPDPLMSADLNGNGSLDLSDLVYFVAFMFQNGPPPVG